MGLTVVGDGVYPLVERGVELGDYVLLPLLADKAEERLRLVDGILHSPRTHMSTAPPKRTQTDTIIQFHSMTRTHRMQWRLTMVRIAKARI